MLLEKHTAVRKGRIHDDKVTVMRSNLRWCSDGLGSTCWNGVVIRLAFIIDACDREMMLEAVEKRLCTTRAAQAIEHLSDNDSAYTAKDSRIFL
ncbi:insertion element IS2 transposase InsD [Agrobacterium sp. DSM 25558]|nr:insertion element IS2 transposase InsD [Agrobacterium sp. DSM 25558]